MQGVIITLLIIVNSDSLGMRPDARHKSRSVPMLRTRIYQKIGIKFQQQKWRQFLEEELSLEWPIRELSKAEFDVNSHGHHKFSMRQNFITKKEIIKCLQKGDQPAALAKLEQLRGKMALIGQQRGAEVMMAYLECRGVVREGLQAGEEERVIAYVKAKVQNYLNDAELYLMKLKCLGILSIMLLRFHGILMSAEERNIVFRTVQLKKKKFRHLDLQQQRDSQFQSLLYLLQELYRLLFLLKNDQHLIRNYYNQLQAYTEVYLQNTHHKPAIDHLQLRRTLKDMKPLISDLDVYEDSKVRRQLAVAHIKEEIVQRNQNVRGSIDLKKRNDSLLTSFNTKMGSSQKLASSSKLRLGIVNSRKLRIENERERKSGISEIAEERGNQLLNQLSIKGLNFEFLLPIMHKFFIVKTAITFRNGFDLVDVEVRITKKSLSCEIFRFLGMEMCLQHLTLDGACKFIEKLFMRLFGSGLFVDLHNLITIELEAGSYLQQVLPVMVRCKAILKQYFRRTYYEQPLNCAKFIYPKKEVAQLKSEFEAEAKEALLRLQKANFAKRKAIINRDQEIPRVQHLVHLKCILAKRSQEKTEYFMANAHFKQCFKGLDLLFFKDDLEIQELPLYVDALKEIAKAGTLNHKAARIARSIDRLLAVPIDQQQILTAAKDFKVESELQLNQQKLKYESLRLRCFSRGKHRQRQTKNKEAKWFEVIATKKGEYSLFSKEIDQKRNIVYKNHRTKIGVPRVLDQRFKLVKKRFRMYNSIKVVQSHDIQAPQSHYIQAPQSHYIQAPQSQGQMRNSRSRNKLANVRGLQEQNFLPTFLRHCVLKQAKGYFMVLVYKCPRKEYLYEVVCRLRRYFFFEEQSLPNCVLAELNTVEMKFRDKQLQLFAGRSKKSQASDYYLQTKKGFHAQVGPK